MSRAEIQAAVKRGAVERAAREGARAHEAEAKRMREDRRRREWGELVAAQREFLVQGALFAFIEEMEARGGIDAVMDPSDPLLALLMPGEPDLVVLLEAVNGIEGARARMLGTAIEVAWERNHD